MTGFAGKDIMHHLILHIVTLELDFDELKEAHSNAANNCPPTWSVFGSNCYKFFEIKKSFNDAEKHCLLEGAHLASVHSVEENNFLANLSSDQFYFGGNDMNISTAWAWSDNSPWVFTNWHPGQPYEHLKQTRKDNCVEVNWKIPGKWNDTPCKTKRKFVCKIINL